MVAAVTITLAITVSVTGAVGLLVSVSVPDLDTVFSFLFFSSETRSDDEHR